MQQQMETYLKRAPKRVGSDRKDLTPEEEYEHYKLQTREEYELLMMEFEFRCHRAAMINYHESSSYDKKVYLMELLAAVVGALSVTTVGVWMLQQQKEISFTRVNQLGSLGLAGLAVAGVIELIGKGSTKVIPSFSKRAEGHIAVGAAWQRLAHKTRSYRIQLDNPKFDVHQYAEWYDDLIVQREKLCTMVSIPQSTYNLYNNTEEVFKSLKQRRLMFREFLQLEEMDCTDICKKNA